MSLEESLFSATSPVERFGRSDIFEPHLFSVVREFLGIKRIIPDRKEIISIEKIPLCFDLDDSFVQGDKIYMFWSNYHENIFSMDHDGIRCIRPFVGRYFRDEDSLHVVTNTEYSGYQKYDLDGIRKGYSTLHGKVRSVYKNEGYDDAKIEKIFGIEPRSGFNHMTICDIGLIVTTKNVCAFGDSSIVIVGWDKKVVAKCIFDTVMKVGSDGCIFTFEATPTLKTGIKTIYKISTFK